MKTRFFLFCILTLIATTIFAQQQPSAPKNSAEPTKKAEPIDPLALTAVETAQIEPILAEFNIWNQKLGNAQEALLQTTVEKDLVVEKLKLELAAKDAREALGHLKSAQAEFRKWEAGVKKRAACEDCRFDLASGKLVKPAPAPTAPAK